MARDKGPAPPPPPLRQQEVKQQLPSEKETVEKSVDKMSAIEAPEQGQKQQTKMSTSAVTEVNGEDKVVSAKELVKEDPKDEKPTEKPTNQETRINKPIERAESLDNKRMSVEEKRKSAPLKPELVENLKSSIKKQASLEEKNK